MPRFDMVPIDASSDCSLGLICFLLRITYSGWLQINLCHRSHFKKIIRGVDQVTMALLSLPTKEPSERS